MTESNARKRRYPRLNALVFYRATERPRPKPPSRDSNRGGIGVYGDDYIEPGEQLEVDLFFPDQTELRADATVAWIGRLPDDAEARYHIGLEFNELPPGAEEQIKKFGTET